MMLSSGLRLPQALEILCLQAKKQSLKNILQSVQKSVEGGSSLSVSLGKYPDVFDKTYIALLRAGEASGNLDKVTLRLSENLEKERELKGKIKGALVYPIIISLAMVGVFVIVMIFVIPKLTQMYASLNVDLPLPTKVMIAISNFMVKRWWALLLLIIGGVFGFAKFRKTASGRYHVARLVSFMPIFGGLSTQSQVAEFTRTLALLLSSGVPIVESLNIASDAASNPIMRDSLAKASNLVEKGLPLSDAIRRDKNFPEFVYQMCAMGEETGRMDDAFIKVSGYYEMEVDRIVKNLTTAMEPLIMVGLGAMVGILIISIITPIYKLTSSF
jgi:type IV pilus assembly protein PilC